MNPLQEYPSARQWVYRAFWVIGVALGAVQAGYTVAEHASPAWVKVALGVLAYLSIATNYTADRNVTPSAVIKADSPSEITVQVSDPQVSSEGVTYDGFGAPIEPYEPKHDRED